MSIALNRFNLKQISPINDVRLFKKMFPVNGILRGCVLTHLGSNQVSITAGTGILEGEDYEVAAETLLVQLASSGTMPGRIYVHCDLSDSVTPISILSVCASTLPALVQDANFLETNGVWEEELATYTGTTTAITDLTVTYENVSELLPRNSVLNTLEDVLATTVDSIPCGTKPVKELNTIVTYMKGTQVWLNSAPTSVFTAQTVSLSESATNYTKAEVIFKVNNGLTEYSTTGILDIALIKMLRAPFFIENARSVSLSGTSAIFGSGYTYNTYSNGTGTQADGYCVPYQIIFYK